MDTLGPEAPGEHASRTDAKRFKVVASVAAILSVLFVLPHLASVMAAGTFMNMYSDMGGELPALTQFVIDASRTGLLALLLLAVDTAIFAGMYVLAKRYWIGLLFAPPFAYAAITSMIGWTLYMPMFEIVTLVQ